MSDNIFELKSKFLTFDDFINYSENSRKRLGQHIPLFIPRNYFADKILGLKLNIDSFIIHLQKKLDEYKIGIHSTEKFINITAQISSEILSNYTPKPYVAIDIDCLSTGNRIYCFDSKIVNF